MPDGTSYELTLLDPFVFISYAKEDRERVVYYFRKLQTDNLRPWLDEHHIPPGYDWDQMIKETIHRCRFFLVFLSSRAVTKRGYIQREIKEALEIAEEMPEGRIYIIPVRLQECNVPQRLRKWQWVDIFKRGGYLRLKKLLVTELGDAYDSPREVRSRGKVRIPKFRDPVDSLLFSVFLQSGSFLYGKLDKDYYAITNGHILHVRKNVPKKFHVLKPACLRYEEVSPRKLKRILPKPKAYRDPSNLVISVSLNTRTNIYTLSTKKKRKAAFVAAHYFNIVLCACRTPNIYVFDSLAPIVVDEGRHMRFAVMPLRM